MHLPCEVGGPRLTERDLAIEKRVISGEGPMYLLNGYRLASFTLTQSINQAIFQGPCNRRSKEKEYALNRPSGFEEAPKKVRLESRVMGDYLVRFGEHLSSPDRLTGVNLGPYRVDS